jgi:hypothetical protein
MGGAVPSGLSPFIEKTEVDAALTLAKTYEAIENSKENTIWVNTDSAITGWHFGADEPNVYDIRTASADSLHHLICPRKLSVGDILNFTIPATVPYIYEALRIEDATGKLFYIRDWDKTTLNAWDAGFKVSVRISNEQIPIGDWGGSANDGSAIVCEWGSYEHTEGTVWITTGATSPVAFNALKKNSIQVYPISAKQWIGGAWLDKTAQTYQCGKWCDWALVLYSYGTTSVNWYGGASLEADHIRITGNKTFESDVFNLDGLSRLNIINDYTWDNSNTHSKPKAEILNESGTVLASVELAMVAGVRTKVTLDVSNISGRVKLKLTGVTSNYEGCKIDIYEIVFE